MSVGVRLYTLSPTTGEDRINVPMGHHQYRHHGTFHFREKRREIYSICDRLFLPGDAIPKQKKLVNQMNCQNVPSSRRKMTLFRFEVRVGGITHAFGGPDHFLLWLQGEEDTSTDIWARGVPARGGTGSQEVADFFCQELRLAKLPGRWQKRTLQYLRNQCGHRFLEEGAACKARGEISSGEVKESRCEDLGLQADDISLQ